MADSAWGELDWLYDGVGNRTQQMSYADGSTTTDVYSYPSDSNRLEDIVFSTGGLREFTYDAAGNVTFDNRNGPGYGYNYDAANRMSSFAINGVIQAEYEYNALGQQVIRRLTQAGQTIHSIHDGAGNRIAEYLYDESAGTSSLIREYIWANGQIVGVYENSTLYYVRTDHIGRPVFATDGTGTKVWEASYLPFGGVEASSGPNPELRFPGQWFQSETGLHQNWMRDYDPTTGRYMQADPLGLVPGPSLYGYAYQSPMMYVDPDGENPLLVGAAIGLAFGLLDEYLQHGMNFRCYNITNIAISTGLGAVGGGLGWRAAGAARAGPNGNNFSHFIPSRADKLPGLNGRFGNWLLGRGNKYNGNFVERVRHYRHDRSYYGNERGDGLLRRNEWGSRYSPPRQFFDRIPNFWKGAIGAPGAWAALSFEQVCECNG